jgi:hypothetical protein
MLFCKHLDDPHCEFFSGVSVFALANDGYAGWDAHCLGLMAVRKREAEWKEASETWETAPTNSVVGWDVPEDNPCQGDWQASDAKLFLTAHAISNGWPSVEGGVEVSMEVCSNVEDMVQEHTACRCSCIRTDLSF